MDDLRLIFTRDAGETQRTEFPDQVVGVIGCDFRGCTDPALRRLKRRLTRVLEDFALEEWSVRQGVTAAVTRGWAVTTPAPLDPDLLDAIVTEFMARSWRP